MAKYIFMKIGLNRMVHYKNGGMICLYLYLFIFMIVFTSMGKCKTKHVRLVPTSCQSANLSLGKSVTCAAFNICHRCLLTWAIFGSIFDFLTLLMLMFRASLRCIDRKDKKYRKYRKDRKGNKRQQKQKSQKRQKRQKRQKGEGGGG